MSIRKYQRAEGFDALSKREHDQVGDELRKVGKKSMTELDPQEREAVSRMLDEGAPNHSNGGV